MNATIPTTALGTGIHKISVPEYDALTQRVRSTQLKELINGSPKHLRAKLDDDDEEPDSDAFELGNAFHTLVLEPELFSRTVVVFKDGASRKSVAYDKFRDRNRGKTILLEKEVPQVKAMSAAVLADPDAKRYLAQVRPEMTVLWTDEETGIECRSQLDAVDETDLENPTITELKSARDAGGDKFSRQADDLLYTLSWAMYREGYHAVRGVWPEIITIVAEKAAPWDVVVYRIDEETIEAGTNLLRQSLRLLKECRASNRWPGKGMGKVQTIELKPWARGVPRERDLQDVRF